MFTGDTKLTELLNSYLVSIFSTKKDHLNLERTEQKSLNPNWSPVSIWTSVVRKYWTTLNESFQPQTNCIQGTEWAWKSDQTQYWSSLRNHHTQGKKSHTKNFKDTSILPKGEKCEFLKFLNIKVEFGLLENTWTHWFYTHTHTHTQWKERLFFWKQNLSKTMLMGRGRFCSVSCSVVLGSLWP